MEVAHAAQTLAYLGDAVFELYVRTLLSEGKNVPVRELNRLAKKYVSARAQSKMYHAIYDELTEEEQQMLKRGRNLNPLTRAKNATVSDYRHATGLETLFGFLYVNDKTERIKEVFEACVKAINGG